MSPAFSGPPSRHCRGGQRDRCGERASAIVNLLGHAVTLTILPETKSLSREKLNPFEPHRLATDRAITAEDFDALMDVYAEDSTLFVKPRTHVSGKAQIRQAFVAIAEHFNHTISISQGQMKVDTTLVIVETILNTAGADGGEMSLVRPATYVFRKSADGKWLCIIDNSCGNELLAEG